MTENSKLKSSLTTIAKFLFAFALLYWMVASGKLDFGELQVFLKRLDILSMNIGVWLFGAVMLGAYRWNVLLSGLDLTLPYFRALQLQLIGLFFNTAMPSAVGGDIIKGLYVMREQRAKEKTSAMLTVLLDRVVGVGALFTIALVGVTIGFDEIWKISELHPLVYFIYSVLPIILVGFVIVFLPYKNGDPFIKLLDRKIPGFGIIKGVYVALRTYRNRIDVLLRALGISIVLQLCYLTFYWYVTKALTGVEMELGVAAAIVPIAVLTTAIPLTPGGLGVGHVAFDQLYELAGYQGGANVFNAVFLGQMAMNLLGSIPYLMFKSKLPNAEEMKTIETEE